MAEIDLDHHNGDDIGSSDRAKTRKSCRNSQKSSDQTQKDHDPDPADVH